MNKGSSFTSRHQHANCRMRTAPPLLLAAPWPQKPLQVASQVLVSQSCLRSNSTVKTQWPHPPHQQPLVHIRKSLVRVVDDNHYIGRILAFSSCSLVSLVVYIISRWCVLGFCIGLNPTNQMNSSHFTPIPDNTERYKSVQTNSNPFKPIQTDTSQFKPIGFNSTNPKQFNTH